MKNKNVFLFEKVSREAIERIYESQFICEISNNSETDIENELRYIKDEGLCRVFFSKKELKENEYEIFKNHGILLSDINKAINFNFDDNTLDNLNFDIIGDVHGDYEALANLLVNKLGFNVINDTVKSKKKKIMFLGDFINKGYESSKVLKLVMNSVKNGSCIALKGNHEDKISKDLRYFLENGKIPFTKFSNKKTLKSLMDNYSINELHNVLDFLEGLPTYFVYNSDELNFLFCHANISSFKKGITTNMQFLYGSKNKESDIVFDNSYTEHGYKYIHGHSKKPDNYEPENVVSLESGVCFENGYISAFKMNDFFKNYLMNSSIKITDYIVKEKSQIFEKQNLNELEVNNLYNSIKNLSIDGVLSFDDYFHQRKFFFYKKTKMLNDEKIKIYNKDIVKKGNGIVFNFDGTLLINPINVIPKYNYSMNDKEKHMFYEKIEGRVVNISYSNIMKEYVFSTSNFMNDKKSKNDFNEITNLLKPFFDKNKNSGKTYSFVFDENKNLYLLNVADNNIYNKKADLEELNELVSSMSSLSGCLVYRPLIKTGYIDDLIIKIKTNPHKGFIFINEKNDMIFEMLGKKSELYNKLKNLSKPKIIDYLSRNKEKHFNKNVLDRLSRLNNIDDYELKKIILLNK